MAQQSGEALVIPKEWIRIPTGQPPRMCFERVSSAGLITLASVLPAEDHARSMLHVHCLTAVLVFTTACLLSDFIPPFDDRSGFQKSESLQ
jgi:hypothetical protein